MRWSLTILLLLASLAGVYASDAITGRVNKVLPMFLDLKGQDAISPSLFDRDAYQAHLRSHTNEVSAIRFDVLWKSSAARTEKLKLRAELRGIGERGLPRQATLETQVTPAYFRSWTSLTLGGTNYTNFGTLVAWRVTLWDGDNMLAEQKSFLW